MRILVTGGNGYVGRDLTTMLAEEHEICVADLLRYGDWRFAPALRARLRLERIDIRDAGAVAALMADFQPDVTVHLAALHYIPECEAEPALAVSTNVVGTHNLLLHAPRGSRFVFASSGAVYEPEERPHRELHSAVGPSDVYGLTKLHGEHYVQQVASSRDLRAIIVRLFNVIGPGETNPHLLPEIVAQLKSGRTTIELGNLTSQRDYVFVRDAARGFAAAALGGGVEPGESCVVNLGTARTHSVLDIVEKLRRVSGIAFSINQAESRKRRVDRPFLAADTSRMQHLFGWQPHYGIDDALAELWREPDLAHDLVARYR